MATPLAKLGADIEAFKHAQRSADHNPAKNRQAALNFVVRYRLLPKSTDGDPIKEVVVREIGALLDFTGGRKLSFKEKAFANLKINIKKLSELTKQHKTTVFFTAVANVAVLAVSKYFDLSINQLLPAIATVDAIGATVAYYNHNKFDAGAYMARTVPLEASGHDDPISMEDIPSKFLIKWHGVDCDKRTLLTAFVSNGKDPFNPSHLFTADEVRSFMPEGLDTKDVFTIRYATEMQGFTIDALRTAKAEELGIDLTDPAQATAFLTDDGPGTETSLRSDQEGMRRRQLYELIGQQIPCDAPEWKEILTGEE